MNDVIIALSTVSAGTVLKWILICGAIIGAIVTASVKCYKMFEKVRQYENKRDEHEEFIKQTKEDLSDLKAKYIELTDFVKTTREESNRIDQIKLRHSIVRSCEEAINNGTITFDALRSIDELYEVYHDVLHGNSYAADLVNMIHTLPVIKRSGQ